MSYMRHPAYVYQDGDSMVFHLDGRTCVIPIDIFDVVAFKRCHRDEGMAERVAQLQAEFDAQYEIDLAQFKKELIDRHG